MTLNQILIRSESALIGSTATRALELPSWSEGN